MARLPVVGSDDGAWGNLLNEFLAQVHASDGGLKDGIVTAAKLDSSVQSALTKANAAAPADSVPQTYQDYVANNMTTAAFEIPFAIDNAFDITNTTANNKYLPVIFDPTRFSSTAEVYFRTDLSQTAVGSGTVYVRLYNMTTGATVASTQLSATIAQYNHSIQTSGNIKANLTQGPAIYSVEVWVQNGYTGQVYRPSIVVRQASVANAQPTAQMIAYSASIAVDASAGETVKVGTLTGNTTVNAPSNAALGRALTFIFYQDATGGRMVSWNAVFRSPPPVDTTPSSVSVVSFVYDGSQWV
jgi:hypothetical protein